MRNYWALIATLMVSVSSMAAIPGFETLNDSFQQDGPDTIVKNMPAVRSQDGIGLCGAFVAATLLEHQYCKATKVAECDKLPANKRLSVLDLSRFSIDSNELKRNTSPDDYPKSISEDGVKPFSIILNSAFLAKSIVPESCAPFDVLVAKAQDPSQQDAMEKAMWENFKKTYEQFQSKSKQCAECALQEATSTAKEWKENYDLKTDNVDILKAFSAKTYNEFLSQVLVPKKCYGLGQDIRVPTLHMNVANWPNKASEQNYAANMKKIKAVLGTDQPIVLSNLCLLENPSPACSMQTPKGKLEGSHSVVVTGYRKMCNKNKPDDCYDTLRVQNSWGQTWQDQNNGGWVKAETLLAHTSYLPGTMTWLEKEGASK